MEVWHGTYQKFTEFNPDFIGTGEGGTESGWGFYFAENKRGGEYFAEYMKFRHGIGYLYRVELKFSVNEIILIDKIASDQNHYAYNKAMSVFSKYTDETHLRLAFNNVKAFKGNKNVAQELLHSGIKVILSSHMKNLSHGHSYIALDHTIIEIKDCVVV